MQRASGPSRCGYTLVELVVVITIASLLVLSGVRALAQRLDRLAVRTAIAESGGAIARARDDALARHEAVTVRIDTTDGTLLVRAGEERIARYALAHAHGVRLAATRDSLTFDVRGLGRGASNLTLVARRGVAAETLVVSRLGRVRD